MHSTALILMQHVVRPPSPVSGGSDDETSMDTTRVYFGPFQTPEKRFTAIAAIPDPEPVSLLSSQDVAIRARTRSDSFSSFASTNSNEIMDVEQLLGVGKPEHVDNEMDMATPPASGIPDDNDPPSALASRLLCAPGNPSPPPSPTLLPVPNDDDTDEANTDGDGEGFVMTSAAPISPTLEPPHLAVSPAPGPLIIEEPDLMSFHSFDDRLDPVTSVPSEQEIAGQPPPSPFSFPDTIPPSDTATHQAVEPFQGRTEVLIDVQDEPSCVLIPVSSQQNDKIIEGKANTPERNMPIALDSESSMTCPQSSNDDSSEIAAQVVHDNPHTPLRRSPRPRKSATPHILKYAASPSGGEHQASSPLRATRPDAQTRKNKRGKERASSPSKCEEDSGTLEMTPQPGLAKSGDRPSDVKTQRRSSSSPVRRVFTRELGSLSPNSAELLSSLVPRTDQVESESGLASTGSHSGMSNSNTNPDYLADSTRRSSELSPPAARSDNFKGASGVSSPARIPVTPRKTHIPTSPSKLQFHPASLDDPTRTPARRVPIEQAVTQGHVSPQKLSQMQSGSHAPVSMFTGQIMPVLNMSLKGDSSPARRILVAPAITSERASHKGSPGKTRLNESPGKQAAVLPVLDKRVKISQPTKLPFPLIVEPHLQATSKRKMGTSDDLPHHANQSKSSLKQTSSRIPRKKPYSRRLVTSVSKELKKTSFTRASASSKNLAESGASKPPAVKSGLTPKIWNDVSATARKRVIRAVDLSQSSAKQNDLAPDSQLCDVMLPSADAKTNANGASAVGILKRKRMESKSTTHTESRSSISRPPATYTTLSSSASSTVRPTPSSMKSSNSTSNAKHPVMKFRRVMPPNPIIPSQPPTSQTSSQTSTSQAPIHESSPEPNLSPVTKNGRQVSDTREEAPLQLNENMILSFPVTARLDSPEVFPPIANPRPPSPLQPLQPSPQSLVFVIDPLSPVSSSNPLPVEYSSEQAATVSGRRRTRLSNSIPMQPDTDTFRSYPGATSNAVRPLQRRRTNSAVTSRMDDVFSSMSMTALKTLTASNTARNQQYLAASLETEIVRKNGFRPESPAVKIKTIVQRQQEEKVKQREERAARRARRQGNPDVDEDLEGNSENAGYMSPNPENDFCDAFADVPTKHRRGAGDEEDYETPFKAIDGGKRRVKWDKGLFTQVFLDEVVPAMKAVTKENVAIKGCLTPNAKRLQLDTLGNLIEPENPLSDLTRENVVVKKFIYDDDIEAAPPPSAIPVPRNTRSRTKKGKG